MLNRLKRNNKSIVFLILYVLLFLLNQITYAEESNNALKHPINLINNRLKYRVKSDKIPVYSYNQCIIGNCSSYSIPDLEKTPEEQKPKKLLKTEKPKEIPEFLKSKEFKAKDSKTKKNVFDYKNIDTSLTNLRINNTLNYDFEVIIWQNGSVSVPVKTLADLVEIPVTINHVNNNISFLQPLTNTKVIINPTKSKVTVGANLIEVKKPKIIFLKEGFFVENEVFIPEELAKYLFDVDTAFIEKNYTLDLKTKKILKAIIKMEEQKNYVEQYEEKPIDFVSATEKENKIFKPKNLSYSLSSTTNQTSSVSQNATNQNFSASIASKGNLFGGKYNIGTNAYYNENGGMELGGYIASLNYIKTQKELSIGSVNARLSELAVPGANIVGVKYGTLGASNNSRILPHLLIGKAEDNTSVELFINDIYTDKQEVKNNQYEFDSINYPSSSFVKVKIEQVRSDNTRTVLYEDDFSQDSNLLAPGQKEYLVFSGIDNSITRQRLKLFGGKSSINRYSQPLKTVIGAKYRKGMSQKLTMGTNIAHSQNMGADGSAYSSSVSEYPRSFRQSSSTSGSVASVDMDYAPTENLRIASELGISNASSLSMIEPNSSDFGSFVSFDYDQPQYNLSGKVFSYGSDFYSGGYSNAIDKRGMELYGSYDIDSVNFTGSIMKYNSNLDNLFLGDLSTITDYTMSVSGPIDKNATLRAGVRSNSAENSLYYNNQTNFDLRINRRLSDKTDLIIDYIKTINRNDVYFSNMRNTMTNDRFNLEIATNLNKLGKLRISHEIMVLTPQQQLLMSGISASSYKPPVYKYLRLKLDRSNRLIKGFTISPNLGYRYGGKNKGALLGMQIGYEFAPGQKIMLNYAYNSVFNNYLNGLNISGSSSHSLSLNFVDNLNFGMGNYRNGQGLFPYSADNGIIKGFVFLDLNQNGFKELDEVGVPYIDITVKNMYTITTDENGYYVAPNLYDRIYHLEINKNTLPVIYNPTTNDIAVRVKKSKVYVANHGLIITPGSISGRVKTDKDNIAISEVIILLLDKEGKEVQYTTTSSTGSYYLSSISPGKYHIVVDNNYLDYNGLQVIKKENHSINIPVVLDDFVDIENIDFNLIPKQAEVINF